MKGIEYDQIEQFPIWDVSCGRLIPDRTILTLGNKQLALNITLEPPHRANTYIKNIEGRVPVPGATTALYRRAHQLMQEAAFRFCSIVRYNFISLFPNMQAWAEDPSKGAGIFKWEETIKYNGYFSTSTSIKPYHTYH